MKRLTTTILLTLLPMTTTLTAEQPNRTLMFKTSIWTRTYHLRVLHKGSETSPSTEYAEVEAYKAEFKPTDKMQDMMGSIGLVVIFDKQTHRHFVIDGDHNFYIMNGNHLIGYMIPFTGECIWSDDYISGPTSAETSEILKKIETSLIADTVRKQWLKRFANRMDLEFILPRYFFSDAEAPGGKAVTPDIFSIESHGDFIRLRLKNPITHKIAHLEMNPKNKTAKLLPLIL